MTVGARARLFFAGGLILLFLFLWQSTALLSATQAALLTVAKSILPSLFPFLVLSGVLADTARGLRLPLGSAFRALFHLPDGAMLPFLLGALCGFPVGVKTVRDLYVGGALTKEEAAWAAALSANAGPAFAVAGIGGAILGSTALGWQLYALQLLSALLLGILSGRLLPKPKENGGAGSPSSLPLPFTEILGGAAFSMLSIAATVTFFGALAGLVAAVASPLTAAALAAILEIGNAAALAAALPHSLGLPLLAFSLSFSGVSVLLQSTAFLLPQGIPVRPLIMRKLVQGLLAALLSLLLL